MQILYLLWYILPNGLPNLKSLNIDQSELSSKNNNLNHIEGSLWNEIEFKQTKWMQGSRTTFNSFVHSIVRAVPNLEELGFDRGICQFSDLVSCELISEATFFSKFLLILPLHQLSIKDDLNLFPHLKHLYYQESTLTLTLPTDEERSTFTAHVADLAEAVPGLVTVTNVAHGYLPYLSARIRRREEKENGEVVGVEIGEGYGMKIGYSDKAFPWALN